jgi:hypothetical protein
VPANEYLVKGTAVRAHLDYLRSVDQLVAVRGRLSAAAVELVDHPPLPGTWTDAHLLGEVTLAVHAIGGDRAVLEMARAVVTAQSLGALIPMVESVLRIFGTSPARLFERYDDLLRTTMRGLSFRYQPTSDRSGTMRAIHHSRGPLHRASFLSTVPPLEMALRLCGATGTVGMPEILGPREASYAIAW